MTYPKRLIEVDLPIARISAHARREKSIRHGHISTLHIWWARRPLAACRAVICAALWPDPADPLCPQAFRDEAARLINAFAHKAATTKRLMETCSPESLARWEQIVKSGQEHAGQEYEEQKSSSHFPVPHLPVQLLRSALLDFIADFANWDNSTVKEYLETSRALTQTAHEALGGAPGTRPLVVDPFAGGGSIPLEALRVGADAFASDLNPVAVLLNKVVLEYIPKYGQRLADEVRRWGQWIKQEAEKELAEFYPKDPDGATPIAYLWARTIQCEGPGCGAEVPLIRSLWLAKKANRSIALQLVPKPRAKRVDFRIIVKQGAKWVDQADPESEITAPHFDGTVKRGSATCPCCGYTTSVVRVRQQLKERRGGADDARLFTVITSRSNEQGRYYRLPKPTDEATADEAAREIARREKTHRGTLSLIPDESLDTRGIRHTWGMIYGLDRWGNLFSPRQALALTTLVRLATEIGDRLENSEAEFARAVESCMAIAVNRQVDRASSICHWDAPYQKIANTFGRQALPIAWDFVEGNIFSGATGDFEGAFTWVLEVVEANSVLRTPGTVANASATENPLPNDSASALFTDPPYYDAVPYSYFSDFFHVWLRRSLAGAHPELFSIPCVPKAPEIVVDRPHELSDSTHDIAFYERELTKAFGEGRRVLRPDGIGTIVFASKTTASWEAILKAVVDAGWIITGSWPIDTEMENRVSARGQARLTSSVHLVCRPREHPDGSVRCDDVGDWRDVLAELPRRIHEWMPRLAEEGVVGADAIFACLGPALEVFSRHSRVEKASGEVITLREYLEQVWAAVSTEALSMIFKEADAAGLEPDARLTAMWLWTLGAGKEDNGQKNGGQEDEEAEETEAETGGGMMTASYGLEYDAARKIAQGLGVHLEEIASVVEVKGDKARLRSVAERTKHLFGKDEAAPTATRRKKKSPQKTLFEDLDETEAAEGGWSEMKGPALGETVLDRVHQAMILFAAGRTDAIKRFLVEDGAGTDARFWKLAQSLSALYPKDTDEKRWVDGVLARKKGWGL